MLPPLLLAVLTSRERSESDLCGTRLNWNERGLQSQLHTIYRKQLYIINLVVSLPNETWDTRDAARTCDERAKLAIYIVSEKPPSITITVFEFDAAVTVPLPIY